MKYQPIVKTRRESFGGIIFREKPAFVAYVNKGYADSLMIPETPGAIIQDGVFSAPLDAHIALTTRCNMYCNGCYATVREDKPKDIPVDKAKAVIDKLSGLGVFSLSFGGGEPTLHPEIFEVAGYAREKQILPNMTTNGLSMTESFAARCSVFGNVHFSMHSIQDAAHVFSAARIYGKTTGNKPGLNLLLTKETLPHIDEIIAKAGNAGFGKILFLKYKTTAKNRDIKGLSADEELQHFFLRLKTLKRANLRQMFLFDCSLFELLAENGFSDVNTCRKFDYHGCQGGNAYIAIDVNGMYKPCSFWHEPIGDILDLSFDQWIHDPALNRFRTMRKDKSCAVCEFEGSCNGGCRLPRLTSG